MLKALNTPKLGDSLLKPDGTPWMADLEHMAPKLNWDDLNQTAALPLGSWLKTDPWDDKVHMLNAKRYAPMNARDKMPFEVTPIFYKLQRYEVASASPATAPASQTPGQPEQASPPAQPAPVTALPSQPAAQPTTGKPHRLSLSPHPRQRIRNPKAPQARAGPSTGLACGPFSLHCGTEIHRKEPGPMRFLFFFVVALLFPLLQFPFTRRPFPPPLAAASRLAPAFSVRLPARLRG